MVPEALRLHATFVGALPAYATARCAVRGYPLDRMSVESIDRAAVLLDAELGAELELPFLEQRRSPLEIVRRVLATVSDALADGGVEPNVAGIATIDGDPYGLSPGSSSDLGQDAHEAHLLWGAAKAAAFTVDGATVPAKPSVVVMAANRSDRDQLVGLVEAGALRGLAVRNPGAVAAAIAVESVVFALVDLGHRSARDAIHQLVTARVATIAYGDAITDLVETGLRAQGVRDVVDRRRLLENPAAFVPVIA